MLPPNSPFSLYQTICNAIQPKKQPLSSLTNARIIHDFLPKLLAHSAELIIGCTALHSFYERLSKNTSDNIFKTILDTLNVTYLLKPHSEARIPLHGSAIVVANHPTGMLDGIIVGALLLEKRSDVKILANGLLMSIPELHNYVIPVNPFGGDEATRKNMNGIRAALDHVQSGGILVVFPAGEVSSFHFSENTICDKNWNDIISRIAQKTATPIIPIYLNAKNTFLFHLAGCLHDRLRTALLARQFLNKSNAVVTITIGKAISAKKITKLAAPDLTELCRSAVYTMAYSNNASQSVRSYSPILRIISNNLKPNSLAPIDQPIEKSLLLFDIQSLDQAHIMCQSGEYTVYCARTEEIPAIVREIGRLREVTFREIGEGTGKSSDLDEYDAYYKHLFIWNNQKQEVIGAYRVGFAGEIVQKFGKKGLYIHSLFKLSNEILPYLSRGLELGRSFVRKEYQRSFQPLLLLWKGIGGILAQNNEVEFLFGPVSISQNYTSFSREIIAAFLREHHFEKKLSKFITPRNKFKTKHIRKQFAELLRTSGSAIEKLGEIISELENDGKSIPILLKQYSKLGGKFLGLSLDPEFGNCLDAFVFVDVTICQNEILKKYMDENQVLKYKEHHQKNTVR